MLKTARTPFHILAKPAGPLCNLDCDYCFYLSKEKQFAGSNFKMSDEVLETFISSYIRIQPAGTPEVNFGWQGGEPTLMGVPFFEKAVRLQKKYAREGMLVSNSLQTNATLLNDEWGAFFHEHQFLLGVSIDGPEEIHNLYRHTKKGSGSFDAVMKGIRVLQKHRVEFNTLTVVQNNNAQYAQRIYDFLKSIGSTFFQFIPIVEFENGVVGERSVGSKEWGSFLIGIFNAWLEAKDVGTVYIQNFETTLAQCMGQTYGVCVHSPTCGNALALEHNGDLFSCDHYVTPANKLGSITDSSLLSMVNSEKQTSFGAHKEVGLTEECKKCEVLSFCRGGCPKDRVAQSKEGEAAHHQLCEGYYDFYQHSVPIFQKMASCLRNNQHASRWVELDKPSQSATAGGGSKNASRNAPCPCGSGKKFKKCCGV